LKFSGRIDVQKWCAAPANLEQQRVDEVVALVKAGAVPLPVASLGHSVDRNEVPCAPRDLSPDLHRVGGLLESLADVLANDPALVSKFGAELQNLDIAVQVIAALKATVTGDFELGDAAAKLAGLRRSADQALQRAG
jgi:hypothetical protein